MYANHIFNAETLYLRTTIRELLKHNCSTQEVEKSDVLQIVDIYCTIDCV